MPKPCYIEFDGTPDAVHAVNEIVESYFAIKPVGEMVSVDKFRGRSRLRLGRMRFVLKVCLEDAETQLDELVQYLEDTLTARRTYVTDFDIDSFAILAEAVRDFCIGVLQAGRR